MWVLLLLLVGGAGCENANETSSGANQLRDDGGALDAAADDIDAGHKTPTAVDAAAPAIPTGPSLLSSTGLFSDFASRTVAADVRTYEPRYPLWSDGAIKRRYLWLPPGTQIDTSDMDHWSFPVGTKLWKHFLVGQVLIETRLLEKTADGWWMMAYLWREDGSDADAVTNGTANARGTTHDVPSQANCVTCHQNSSDILIGVNALQLSNGGAGFLSDLAKADLLSDPPAGEFDFPGSAYERAALGTLHGNCGYCHNDGSALRTQSVMRLTVSVHDRVPAETAIVRSAVGLKARHVMPPDIDTVIVPGSPDTSELTVRMARRDDWSMPPLMTKVVDQDGLAAVRDWIGALPIQAPSP